MTMRVTIKNEDPARVALVRTEDFNDAGEPSAEQLPIRDLQPGATCEFWVHSTRRIVVSEAAAVKDDAPRAEPSATTRVPTVIGGEPTGMAPVPEA